MAKKTYYKGLSVAEIVLVIGLVSIVFMITLPKLLKPSTSELQTIETKTVRDLFQAINLAETEIGLLPLSFGPGLLLQQYVQITDSNVMPPPTNCVSSPGERTITLKSGVVLAGVNDHWDSTQDYDPNRAGNQSGDVVCAALNGQNSTPEEIAYITLIRKGDHVPGQLIVHATPTANAPSNTGTPVGVAPVANPENIDIDVSDPLEDLEPDTGIDPEPPVVNPGPPNPQNPNDITCDRNDPTLFQYPPQSANANPGPTLGSLALGRNNVISNVYSVTFRTGDVVIGSEEDNPTSFGFNIFSSLPVEETRNLHCIWSQVYTNVYVYDTQTGENLYKPLISAGRGVLGLNSLRSDDRYQLRYYDNLGIFGTKNVVYPLHSLNSFSENDSTITERTMEPHNPLRLHTAEQLDVLFPTN